MACSLVALPLWSCDGCGESPDSISIGRILIDTPRELDKSDKEREAIRAAVTARMQEEEGVALRPDKRDAQYLLRVDVGQVVLVPGTDDQARLVRLELKPRQNGTTYEAIGRGLPLDDIVASVMTGFDDAWSVIDQARWLEVAEDQRVIATLSHPDPRVRDLAIRALGDRKSVAAVPVLCDRLHDEEKQELVLRAVGALVAIGDERAVDPLIELTRRKDPRFVIQIVYALASIGGRTAEGYLVTMASGHPMEVVQKSAEEALSEMQQREAQKKAKPSP